MKKTTFLTLLLVLGSLFSFGQAGNKLKIKANYQVLNGNYSKYVMLTQMTIPLSDKIIIKRTDTEFSNWEILKNGETAGKIEQLENARLGLYWQVEYDTTTVVIVNGHLPCRSWDDNRLFSLSEGEDTLWAHCLEPDCNSHYALSENRSDKPWDMELSWEAQAKKPCKETKWIVKPTDTIQLSRPMTIAYLFITVANNTIRNAERYEYDMNNW